MAQDTPEALGFADRLRRWTCGDYDTHAVLSIAGQKVADVPWIKHAEELMGDAWEAASHIEAQAAEIARLRAALGDLLENVIAPWHLRDPAIMRAQAALAPQETRHDPA